MKTVGNTKLSRIWRRDWQLYKHNCFLLPPDLKVLDLMFLMGFQIIGPVTVAIKVCLNKKSYQKVLNNVVLMRSFSRTLCLLLKKRWKVILSFCHMDCDLYASTKTIFGYYWDRLVSGSCILFDEYFNSRLGGHRWKAWKNFVTTEFEISIWVFHRMGFSFD